MKYCKSGYFAQDLQQSVASTLNITLKRGVLRLNEYAGGVAYAKYSLADPLLLAPMEARAVVNADMRRLLLQNLAIPEARDDCMRELTADWSRYTITSEAYQLHPLEKADAYRGGPEAHSYISETGDTYLVVPTTQQLLPLSILNEQWEATIRIIASVIGEEGKYYIPPLSTSQSEYNISFTQDMADGMYVLERMQEKLRSTFVGKSLITAIGTAEGQALWGTHMFYIVADAWTRCFKQPGDLKTKILLTRMFVDSIPALEGMISTPYEFLYTEGRQRNITDRAIRVLDQSIKSLRYIEPLPFTSLEYGSVYDEFRIQSLSGHWKFVGSPKPFGIDYVGTGFNMTIPAGVVQGREGLAFKIGNEVADVLFPVAISETRRDPGFLRTTVPPDQLATTIGLIHPLTYEEPEAAQQVCEQIRQARITGQSTRVWGGQVVRDDAIGTLIVIDPETTKDGGQVPAFTKQGGYNIEVTSPQSDCVAYKDPLFAQPELDNLVVSYKIQPVNFRTTANFLLR